MARKRGARSVYIAVTGDNKIDKKLRDLGAKKANKIARAAARDGTKVFAAEMENNAPTGETGRLKGSVVVRAPKRKKRNQIAILAKFDGDDFPKGADGKPKYYPVHVEYGTEEQPAQGFGRKAFDEKKAEAEAVVAESMWNGIRKAVD